MTISDSERLRSQLSRLEDMFPGYKTEIVEGNIMMSPLRPFHNQPIMPLWNDLELRLPAEWAVISDVTVPINAEFEFCPDLAVVPTPARDENRSAYGPDLVEFAAEVVSPSSVRNDYEIKNVQYARAGIPVYL
ncbi:Uma2 family endonuclease [Streptomyces sp. GSL17-111]|uniref:Uma2 family endonuclease n=1 Tax=Streptomyces sp. GSL17-111 TaxID=3121596 RepID=UPI0030F3FFD5